MIQLRATKFQLAFTLGCVFVIPLVFVFLFIISWFVSQPPLKYVLIFLIVVPVAIVFSYGSVATEFIIKSEGQMIGSSLFRKKIISITDIRSIDIRRWNRGFIYIRTPGTRLLMYRDMPGALDAMKTIAKNNPGIMLKQ